MPTNMGEEKLYLVNFWFRTTAGVRISHGLKEGLVGLLTGYPTEVDIEEGGYRLKFIVTPLEVDSEGITFNTHPGSGKVRLLRFEKDSLIFKNPDGDKKIDGFECAWCETCKDQSF